MRRCLKINFAYVIIAVMAFVMLMALLSAPRIRRYAREKARAERNQSPAAPTTVSP